MDTYYTIEEKYLQAVEEVNYGETPMGLKLLNEIINNDPLYARAHFMLGKVYYYNLTDYQTAGYHFKTCMQLEPSFPDNYCHYLRLLVFLNMGNQVKSVAEKAFTVAGVNVAAIYNLVGLFHEKNKQLDDALSAYRKALMEVTLKHEGEEIDESIIRVKAKLHQGKAYQYNFVE